MSRAREGRAKTHNPALPTLAQHFDIAGAQRLVVHDKWIGMADGYSSRHSSFALVREAKGGFDGELRTKIDGQDVTTIGLRLERRAANSLITLLGAAPLVAGAYTPRIEWTDDSPDIEVLVEDGSRFAYLFSRSQGELHVPWGTCIGGEVFTSPGDEIGLAIKALRRLMPEFSKGRSRSVSRRR